MSIMDIYIYIYASEAKTLPIWSASLKSNPGIKALSAFGLTREKALSELKVAAEAYFEALEDAGEPLPEPEKISFFSGQLRLRMPKSLHSALATEAKGEGISLNTHIVTLLSERHIEKKLLNKIEESKMKYKKK